MGSRKHNTQKEPDVRESPKDLYNELNEEFRFTLDAAATHENALCDYYYTENGLWKKQESGPENVSIADGLTGPWFGRIWLNPPYSNLGDWVEKAHKEWRSDTVTHSADLELVVMLIPANRTEQKWWHEFVEPFRDRPESHLRTRFIRSRRHFTINGGQPILNVATGKRSSPDFPVMLLIWS